MKGTLRTPSRWLLLLSILALFAAACGGGGEEPGAQDTPDGDATVTETETGGQAVEGGTAVFGADQEPAILNGWLSEGNLFATSVIEKTILYPLWRITPDFAYEPLLLDGEPEVSGGEGEEPFTVTYNLLDEAAWSDGTPISAEDIEFTFQVCLNEEFDITSREGCDKLDMEASEVVDEKTYKAVFTEPYAPWKTILSVNPVLPKHVLDGQDFNTVWNDAIENPETGEPIASGPFKFESWNKGQDLTVTRNDDFWGESAHLDSIVYRFIEESTTQVQALRGGEIDMFYPQPQLDLVEQVEEIEGVASEAGLGPIWEHLDFNFAVDGLGENHAYVRQAIAQAIDRDQIVSELITPLNPDAEPLQNAIYVTNQEEYEPHFDKWTFDPEAARTTLEDNGCTEGDDGIYTCDGVRLSFDYTTTAGNQLRELQLEIIQAQLKDVGIEVNAATGDAATVFGETLIAGPEGAWDLFNFAWVGSPDPVGSIAIFECEGEQNYNSYCNEEVTELLQQTNTAIDESERAALFNEADALMADDLPLLPLYQKPTFFAWNSKIQGPKDNATQWGPTWNVEDWQLTE